MAEAPRSLSDPSEEEPADVRRLRTSVNSGDHPSEDVSELVDQPGRVARERGGTRLSTSWEGPFEFRVTLGDMGLDDGFRLSLPPAMSRVTLGDLLEEVFSEEDAAQLRFLSALDVQANPDLPAMYEELLDIFAQWRRDDCTLRFFAGHGPQVRLVDRLEDHFSFRPSRGERFAAPTLDLAIEQTHDVLGRFADWGGGNGALMKWLQRRTFLYFMDKHRFRLSVDPGDKLSRGLLPIANELASKGLIAGSEESGVYEPADEGEELIQRMVVEAESYIDRFDVFSDTLLEPDEEVEFGTGIGEDLRVQVYVSEGVDPVRAVFLLLLCDSTLDAYSETWQGEVQNEEFFNEFLRPVLDHARVDDELIGQVIESGYAHNEELAETAEERAFEQDVVRRVRSE